jgi:hypothetical protein
MASYVRKYKGESILIIQNLSSKSQETTITQNATDLFTGRAVPQGKLKLKPLKFRWLLIDNS